MGLPVGTVLGGFYGQERSKGDRARSEQQLREMLAALDGYQIPSSEDMAYTPDEISAFQGDLPQEAIDQLGETAMQGIALDPELRRAQYEALSQIQQAGRGEFSPIEKARLEKMQRDISKDERAQRLAIDTQMRRRGIGGSGLELAAKLSNQQAAAERQSMEGLELEGMAQQRALQAIRDAASQAGRMESEDFKRQADIASARDQIQKFNLAQRAGVNQRNIEAQRARQMAGKELETRNVAARNQAGMRRADLPMDQAKMELDKRRLQAGMREKMAGYYGGRAKDTERFYTGLGASGDQAHKENKDTLLSMGGMFGGMG